MSARNDSDDKKKKGNKSPGTPASARDGGESGRGKKAGKGDGSPRSPRGEESPGRRKGEEEEEEDTGPVAFVDKSSVQAFFGIQVIINAVYIGVDVHMRAAGVPLGGVMLVCEMWFFLVFLAELLLRVAADKGTFFNSTWNIIDLVLVVGSGVDLLFGIVFSGQEAEATEDMGKLRAIRILKVTRLIRLVRVFRVFRFKSVLRAMRGLILLLVSIGRAIAALGWVLLLLTISTYLFAIVTTEFLGLANDDDDPEIEDWFGDMLKSMYTLMQISTLEDWGYISRHTGKKFGVLWQYLIAVYVFGTNLILLNVVLAQLVGNVLDLNSEIKAAQAGESEDPPSWMKTPSSLDEEEDEEEKEKERAKNENSELMLGGKGGQGAGLQQSVADRITTQTLSEFFDLASTYVGIEGVNQRRLVTPKSLGDTLLRLDVQGKVVQACPALSSMEPAEMAAKIWEACPRRLDKDGMSRQEVTEAVMTMRGELSMNNFVVISQTLQKMEKHIETELVHLNKHQRKLNRRFLKMRHRLRKVYHFDGAPRKMVEMMNEMKRKAIAQAAEAAMRGDPTPTEVLQRRREEHGDAGSSEASISEESSDDSVASGKK